MLENVQVGWASQKRQLDREKLSNFKQKVLGRLHASSKEVKMSWILMNVKGIDNDGRE